MANKLIFLSAPIAFRSIQMAERDLLRESFSAEAATRKRAIAAQFSALLSAATQQIIAHVQGKIAAIDPALSPAARRAAIEQLIAEQTAAIIQLKHDIKQQRRQARRSAGIRLSARFRKRRSAIVAHHATEREQSRQQFGASSQLRQRVPRVFAAIRRIVPVLTRRTALRPRPLHPRR